MKMNEIREIAKSRHLNARGLSKSELIRDIQRIEGNFDCFASAIGGECDQNECLWRKDCFESAKRQPSH